MHGAGQTDMLVKETYKLKETDQVIMVAPGAGELIHAASLKAPQPMTHVSIGHLTDAFTCLRTCSAPCRRCAHKQCSRACVPGSC